MVRGGTLLAAIAIAAALLGACGRKDPPEPAALEVAAAPGAAPGDGPTLRAIRGRGRINCGVAENRPGFATRDLGQWRGFDVDFCRAVAAAVFGDQSRVRFVPLSANDRFIALQADRVDLIARSGLSFTRDVGRRVDFVGVSFYDDQGFLVGQGLAGRAPADLGGRTVCVQAGSPSELGMVEFYQTQKSKPKSVVRDSEEEAVDAYESRRCEALTGDLASLAAVRASLRNPDAHALIPGPIAKDPQGPFVREGDSQWADVVRWTLNAMILAEELGVTSKTAADDRTQPRNMETSRLLAGDGLGQMLLLRDDWAFQVIRQVGNYGEMFDRNFGPQTALELARGRNAQWNAQTPGLIYAPPMR